MSDVSDDNRYVRKKALMKLQENILKWQDSLTSKTTDDINAIQSTVVLPLIDRLNIEPVEGCQELILEILLSILSSKVTNKSWSQNLIPLILSKLNLSSHSEEMHLSLLRLLRCFLQEMSKDLLDDLSKAQIILILSNSLRDKYAENLKETCNCIVNLATSLDEADFMNDDISLEPLVEPLCQLLKHRHSKVRISAINTIGVILHSDFKRLSKHVEEITQNFGQLVLIEDSATVRKAFAERIFYLLDNRLCQDLESSNLLRFLPLVLTTLSDPVEEIRILASDLWSKCGDKYEQQHKNFFQETKISQTSFNCYPDWCSRPNFGCRQMILRHFRGILPAVLKEVNDDWLDASRACAVSILYQLLLHSEESIAPHLLEILTALIKFHTKLLMEKHSADYVEMGNKCCQLVGFFIDSSAWCETLIPLIANLKINSDACKYASFSVLAMILSSSTYSPGLWMRISVFIAQPEICQSNSFIVLQSLLEVMRILIKNPSDKSFDQDVSFQIFMVLVTASSLSDDNLCEKVDGLLNALSSSVPVDFKGISIYELHSKRCLMEILEPNYQLWELTTPDLLIFDHVIENLPLPLMIEKYDLILQIITWSLSSNKEALFKLKFYTILSKFLSSLFDCNEIESINLVELNERLLDSIFLPQLRIKTPGRSTNILKSATLSCFLNSLSRKWAENAWSFELMEKCVMNLTPILSYLLENSELALCRSAACKVVAELFRLNPLTNARSLIPYWQNLFKAILSRLELDVDSGVRLSSCESMEKIINVISRAGCEMFLDTSEITRIVKMELDMSKSAEQRNSLKNLLVLIVTRSSDENTTPGLKERKEQLKNMEAVNVIDQIVEQINDVQL